MKYVALKVVVAASAANMHAQGVWKKKKQITWCSLMVYPTKFINLLQKFFLPVSIFNLCWASFAAVVNYMLPGNPVGKSYMQVCS